MYVSQITHWSTLAYCKILYVDNLILEKTKSYNISTFEPIQFYINNNPVNFKLILPISKINGNLLQNTNKNAKQKLFSRIQSTHALYLHLEQLKFHSKIKLVHTNFYRTYIRQLEIIEISLTKITKQYCMKDDSNTKCKKKNQSAAKTKQTKNIYFQSQLFKC